MISVRFASLIVLSLSMMSPACTLPLADVREESPQPAETEIAGPPVPEPRFGLVLYSPSGEPYIVETRSIPLVEGSVLGWAVFDTSGKSEVEWAEVFQLAGPSDGWLDISLLSNISISPGKDRAITQGAAPGGGYVMNAWSVSGAVPEGPAKLSVVVEGNSYEFEFDLVGQPLALGEPADILGTALENCDKYVSEDGCLASCKLEMVNAPLLILGIRKAQRLVDDFQIVLDNVIYPFCDKMTSIPYSAIMLVRDRMTAAYYSCHLGEVSGWFELPQTY